MHEDERCKPAAWIPVGWLPNYIDARTKGLRPNRGYESISARKVQLFHRCWIEFLDGWAERTRDAMILAWANGVQRSSRFFLAVSREIRRRATSSLWSLVSATAALQLVRTTWYQMRLLRPNRQSACGSFYDHGAVSKYHLE